MFFKYVFRVKTIKSNLSTQVITDFKEAFEGPNSKVGVQLTLILVSIFSNHITI